MASSSPPVRSVLILFALAACGTKNRTSSETPPPPQAEFLMATQDSTFWISTSGLNVRTRGAPITLARYDGRFFELFLADDNLSYPDALLVGLRVYRRDLASGDSTVVFTDTIVPRIAREYASSHPGVRPLSPDEDGNQDPTTQATADVEVVDVHGPYLSFDYHVDVAVRGRDPWHATRRGVIDLRSGRTARVEDIFPPSVASTLIDSGKRELVSAIDSLRHHGGESARRAIAALAQTRFDERSFVLTVPDSQLAVEFGVPLRGTDAPDEALALEALTPPHPSWWPEIAHEFATAAADVDRWQHYGESGYDVVGRYDSSAETARISLSDRAHEWAVRVVSAPVLHVFWLDRPPIDSTQRRALTRAFDEASLYDDATRTVRHERGEGSVRTRFTVVRSAPRRITRHHS